MKRANKMAGALAFLLASGAIACGGSAPTKDDVCGRCATTFQDACEIGYDACVDTDCDLNDYKESMESLCP